MPAVTEAKSLAVLPLSVLNEEENMFQASIRRFARERIGPHVRAMDEAGLFRRDLLHEMFELGLMGIEIPEEHGGQGGNFFQSVLAVEALAAVDPSAAVIVDVQNTIANNKAALFAQAGP
jgi:alkylation response protein AidB-like acyl-CoA dehydrogenase